MKASRAPDSPAGGSALGVRSLRFKLIATLVGVVVVVTAGLCGLGLSQVWVAARRVELRAALNHAVAIANMMVPVVEATSPERLRSFSEQVLQTHDVRMLKVTDARGDVRVSLMEPTASRKWDGLFELAVRPIGVPRFVKDVDGSDETLFVVVPISKAAMGPDGAWSSKQLLGYLHVGFDSTVVRREFAAAANLVVLAGLCVVFVIIAVGIWLTHRLVAPLRRISFAANKLAEGDLAVRAEIRRADEIGALARDFNRMADEIQRKHGEVTTLHDQLELRVLERTAQLRELASRDPLTGLYNRRHFAEVLERRFSEARRYDSDLSMLMIDADRFKHVNDRYGHQAGDELLVVIALTVASQLRTADVAARYGGDEIVVLLPNTDIRHARAVSDRISRRFREELAKRRFPEPATLSIGLTSLEAAGLDTPSKLIQSADRALYVAKQKGRNRIESADALPACDNISAIACE